MLERRERLDKAGAAAMDEDRGGEAGIGISKATEYFGLAIDPIGIRRAEGNTQV